MVNEIDTAGNVVHLSSLQPLTPSGDTTGQPAKAKATAGSGTEGSATEPVGEGAWRLFHQALYKQVHWLALSLLKEERSCSA